MIIGWVPRIVRRAFCVKTGKTAFDAVLNWIEMEKIVGYADRHDYVQVLLFCIRTLIR